MRVKRQEEDGNNSNAVQENESTTLAMKAEWTIKGSNGLSWAAEEGLYKYTPRCCTWSRE